VLFLVLASFLPVILHQAGDWLYFWCTELVFWPLSYHY